MTYKLFTKVENASILNVRKLLFVFTLILGGTLFAQDTAKKGVFKFETEVIDYGTINQNSDGVRSFKFTNVGNAPIVITGVKGSCGCTVPTKPEGAIMPGESAEIGVKYATDRIGAFSKTVTVTSNASKETVLLTIKGNVLAGKSDSDESKKVQ
ncbi:uncharacterized protein DUF1573 [Ulvibacter sp. MAR_2010_11]|uniref:DUF1573 domain-containing protein n=1 Tax=Ulvibacter sp. MAR_2010_11 TaxID=1250229 RepID=UPI000C2BE1E5|nr:DUF1573 domain-containing protein [Ulvibacter sp. MAR_2010_11]PKA84340.1 uncharacterized protein DUF1573 [Ulvibacter sp. MAR_2010_11]